VAYQNGTAAVNLTVWTKDEQGNWIMETMEIPGDSKRISIGVALDTVHQRLVVYPYTSPNTNTCTKN
jgi:hypothetical protein